MDNVYQQFIATHNNEQQTQSYFNVPQQCWLLQQPKDSGYADGDDDLFAQAFKSYDPAMHMMSGWVTEARTTPALSISSSSSASSPFEYADSLVLPSGDWQPYGTTLTTTYSMDAPAYHRESYHDTSACMVNASANQLQITGQDSYRSSKEQSPMSSLLPSLMEDSVALPELFTAARPRQREHHTAVEQRYRKNLNQQFINLRSAVPNIETTQPSRAGQPAKPSKCEVLSGAVDYIRGLEEEIQRLKGMPTDGLEASRKRARTMH